jgi:hypothetical protein
VVGSQPTASHLESIGSRTSRSRKNREFQAANYLLATRWRYRIALPLAVTLDADGLNTRIMERAQATIYGACWLRLFGLVHRSDLLQQRHQIEVVAEHLDLAVLDLNHLDRLDPEAFGSTAAAPDRRASPSGRSECPPR